MREFECKSPALTITRHGVEPFVAAFGGSRGRGENVVCRHLGVTDLGTDMAAEYPLAGYLGAMKELQEQLGVAFMKKVGSCIFDSAVFPPGIDSLPKALDVINTAYYMNHGRSCQGRIGTYQWRARADRGGEMFCDNPYPCAMDFGMLETIARRFDPRARVSHDPGTCRHEGGESCLYVLEW